MNFTDTTKCLGFATVCVLLVPLTPASSAEVAIKSLDDRLRVEIDGQLFTEYIFQGYGKPIVYPIIGPYGVGMTRNFPMKKDVAGEAEDHPHQTSMWFTHGSVNGVDFWSAGSGAGKAVQDEIVRTASGSDRAVIETKNRWLAPDGKVVCTDTRELTFAVEEGARLIDWTVTIHASHGDVVFEDTKEGTMGIRTHPNLRLQNDARRGVTSANGQARNSEGDTGSGIWGKRAKWVDYSGHIDGHGVGIAIFDHPDNLRHPTWWHARDYGLVAANPFGVHDFENKPPGTGDWKLPEGHSRTFRYRFVFHEGDADAAKIDERYQRFAAPKVGRVLPQGERPNDRRLAALKDLDGYFPFTPPESLQQWQQRAEQVRRQILVATGLWPMPPRGSVNATIHGKVDRDEYTVEKVYLESFPGHFVTGSLYRPKGLSGRKPAVLSPHGHFANGRFHDHGLDEVRKQIVQGAERFEAGGRHPIQARCVQLARMGCVVFQYDMLGYADSQQISQQLAHGHRDRRPEWETPENWGLYSAQAEMRLQNVMGLQTFNSIRALDFLESLPDVDSQSLAITGASGGGTQTMILSAIDPRVAVSFPAVMVSTSMQGGCTCENASCLRVDTGNIEFAGLFAPKPLGMTAADDWTRELATKGYPELQQLYALFGAKELVTATPLTHFEHNYNYVSRGAMYRWLNKHLNLGLDEPIVEEDYQPLSIGEMSVWDDGHPQPPGGAEHERALLDVIAKQSDEQLRALLPRDRESLAEFRHVVGGALETILARSYEDVGTVEREMICKSDQGDHYLFHDVVRNVTHGEELPTVFLHPKAWNGDVVIWVSGQGKTSLFDESGQLRPEVRQLLNSGMSVASADLFDQGEFLGGESRPTQTRKVGNDRDFAGYTFGYNPTLFAQRVHDILTITKFISEDEHQPQRIHLLGVEGAGPMVAAACFLAGDTIASAAIDTEGFRFCSITSWRDPSFVPGAIKYGDVPALLALCAPRKLWITGEAGGEIPEVTKACYAAAGATGNLTAVSTQSPVASAVKWLETVQE